MSLPFDACELVKVFAADNADVTQLKVGVTSV